MKGIVEFAKELRETVNRLMGENYMAEIRCVEKNNIGTIHMLVIINEKHDVSPSFNIEKLYNNYQQNEVTVEEIAEKIVDTYYNIKTNKIETYFGDKEWVRKRLFLQLINGNKNEKLLKDSIHISLNKLALVLYVMVADDENGISKAKVTKSMCEIFGWNEKEILNYALKNTMKLFPYEEFSMYEMFQEFIDYTDMDISKESDMMILTNNKRIFGATTIFYPGVLKELAKKHSTNLFLIPSSIHEFIILKDNGIYKAKELKNMVQEVNVSAVLPEDVLSDCVYYYRLSNRTLSVFNNGNFEKIAIL